MPTADLGDAALHYKTHGQGPDVLGIMGFALDQRYWAAQVPTLSEHHRFITFDNRGIGRSTGPPPGSIDEMADDAVRLLDHLSIDRAVVFGASMGGAIAQKIVLQHPDRVRALILAVTFARPNEYMRREGMVSRTLLASGDFETFIHASLLHLFTPGFFEIGHENVDRLVVAFYTPGAPDLPDPRVIAAQNDAIDKHDVLLELPAISCPTLVVGGRYDMMVPCFASEEIAAAIPGARLEIIDAGHGLMLERAEEFNALVAEFLAEVDEDAGA